MSQQHRKRKRGIRASREKLGRALAEAGLRTQTALAERIADQEDSPTVPRDLINRAFRELPVDLLSLERIARALGVQAHTLYQSAAEHPAAARATAGTPAVAVLPFLDLSHGNGHEYFSDGLTEELLNGLARVPGLRVAGHTSSFAFKGRQRDVQEIAAALGVQAILEGSTRVVDGRVRITAQLVNASDGLALWSGRYAPDLGDIFAVQDEIRDAVIGALELTLIGAAARPARDPAGAAPAAVNAWLQGRFFWNKRTDAGARKAIEYYRRAIALDQRFALPYAGLADACRLLSLSGSWSIHDGYRKAREAARKALELDPELPEAYRSLALIGMEYDWDWEQVAQHCARARELGAGKSEIHGCNASYLETLGRLDEAIEERRIAVLLEPLWTPAVAGLALSLCAAGRYTESQDQFQRVFELDPMYPAHFGLGSLLYCQGRYEEALTEFERDPREGLRLTGAAMAQHRLGHAKRARAALRNLIEGYSHVAPAQIAQVYVQREDWPQAFQWLNRACEQRDPGITEIAFNPGFAPLRARRRYAGLLERIGISPVPTHSGQSC